MGGASLAPEEGTTVPELMDETGMSRPWVYQRLQELATPARSSRSAEAAGAPPTDDISVIVYVYVSARVCT